MVSSVRPELARPTLTVRVYFHLLLQNSAVRQRDLASAMEVGTEKITRVFNPSMFERPGSKSRPQWTARPDYLAKELIEYYREMGVPVDGHEQALKDFVLGAYLRWLRATPAPPTRWEEHVEQIAEFAAGADALATLLGAAKHTRIGADEVRKIAARFVLDERVVDYGLRAVSRLSPKLDKSDRERIQQVRSRLTAEDRKIGQVGTEVTMLLFELPPSLRAGIARTSIRGQQTLMALSVLAGGLGKLMDGLSHIVGEPADLRSTHELSRAVSRPRARAQRKTHPGRSR